MVVYKNICDEMIEVVIIGILTEAKKLTSKHNLLCFDVSSLQN